MPGISRRIIVNYKTTETWGQWMDNFEASGRGSSGLRVFLCDATGLVRSLLACDAFVSGFGQAELSCFKHYSRRRHCYYPFGRLDRLRCVSWWWAFADAGGVLRGGPRYADVVV